MDEDYVPDHVPCQSCCGTGENPVEGTCLSCGGTGAVPNTSEKTVQELKEERYAEISEIIEEFQEKDAKVNDE